MSKWISVHDMVPEVNTPILCVGCDDDGNYLTPNVCTLQDNGKYIIGYKFNSDRAIGFFIETFVTHWMPLPEPPEGV